MSLCRDRVTPWLVEWHLAEEGKQIMGVVDEMSKLTCKSHLGYRQGFSPRELKLRSHGWVGRRDKCHHSPFPSFQAGNLTVLTTDPLLHQDQVQLDFHFRLTPQTSAHWHGLLCDHRLFLDIPYQALDQGNRER